MTTKAKIMEGRNRILTCLALCGAEHRQVLLLELQKEYIANYESYLNKEELLAFFGEGNIKRVFERFMKDDVMWSTIPDETNSLLMRMKRSLIEALDASLRIATFHFWRNCSKRLNGNAQETIKMMADLCPTKQQKKQKSMVLTPQSTDDENDTMHLQGKPALNNNKYKCISAKKKYKNKSLEELRVADYLAGRKINGKAADDYNSLFGQQNQPQNSGLFQSSPYGFCPALFQPPLLHCNIDNNIKENVNVNPHNSPTQTFMEIYNKYNFSAIENTIGYKFINKAYLVQAFTHASYCNGDTGLSYQRLEFLGDNILHYLFTQFLMEHKKQYPPGVLTDIRSALVNNTILASLAVKYNFHKYFLMDSPQLQQMIQKFVKFFTQNGFSRCAYFVDGIFMLNEEEEIDENCEFEAPPKALGDIFESMAGAIYLDCGKDLDNVWRIFYNLMDEVVEKFCENPLLRPIPELGERKNCQVKYMKLKRKLENEKWRVAVNVNDKLHGKLHFIGMGRNVKIAKSMAAKKALIHLRKLDKMKRAEKEREEWTKIDEKNSNSSRAMPNPTEKHKR